MHKCAAWQNILWRMQPIGQIIDFDQLKSITVFKRDAEIQKCLNAQGIKCFTGRKGVWTTIGLIESAGVISANDDDEVDIL